MPRKHNILTVFDISLKTNNQWFVPQSELNLFHVRNKYSPKLSEKIGFYAIASKKQPKAKSNQMLRANQMSVLVILGINA